MVYNTVKQSNVKPRIYSVDSGLHFTELMQILCCVCSNYAPVCFGPAEWVTCSELNMKSMSRELISHVVCFSGRLNITYPMLFKLTNKNSDRMTHCGVLEFVADEGICYLPHWVEHTQQTDSYWILLGLCFWCVIGVDHALFCPQMMQNLLLEEGGLVQVESVNLMVATYSKFQPQSPDFLDITNPKAV